MAFKVTTTPSWNTEYESSTGHDDTVGTLSLAASGSLVAKPPKQEPVARFTFLDDAPQWTGAGLFDPVGCELRASAVY